MITTVQGSGRQSQEAIANIVDIINPDERNYLQA